MQRLHLNSFRTASLLLFGSLVAVPLIFGAGRLSADEKTRVSEVCLDCHDGKLDGLMGTAHQLSSDMLDGADAPVACTDCHLPDSRHWEDDPEEYPMTNPARVDPETEGHICSACHMNSHQQNMAEGNVHTMSDVNCSGCHSVHSAHSRVALLKDEQPQLCYGCHRSVEGQFAQPYRHPVNDEIVKCSECHQMLDTPNTELSNNGANKACYRCHAQFEGPFPYEHPATMDFSTEEGGCLSCHNPHGSAVPNMLKQPYEAPHYQLCTQCHSIPPLHLNNSMHGTSWAGMSCSECHSDIHGSYTSHLFLSETLEGQGCFNVGCHQF